MKSLLRASAFAGMAGGLLFLGTGAAPADRLALPVSGVGPAVLLVQNAQDGTITGKAVDGSGSPLSGLPVTLLKEKPMEVGGGSGPGGTRRDLVAQGRKRGPGGLKDKTHDKIDAVQTDAEGNFRFEKVKPGRYSVEVGDGDNLDAGYAMKGAKVEAGKTLDMGTIKLTTRAPKQGGAKKKGGGGGGR